MRIMVNKQNKIIRNKLKKKSQMSEFISIALMITALVIFMMFSRMSSMGNKLKRTEFTMDNYKSAYILTTTTIIPFITINGVRVSNLIGTYICYKNATIKVDTSRETYFFQAIREKFNEVYGLNMWALNINKQLCITSTSINPGKCYISSEKEFFVYNLNVPKPCKYTKADVDIYIILD